MICVKKKSARALFFIDLKNSKNYALQCSDSYRNYFSGSKNMIRLAAFSKQFAVSVTVNCLLRTCLPLPKRNFIPQLENLCTFSAQWFSFYKFWACPFGSGYPLYLFVILRLHLRASVSSAQTKRMPLLSLTQTSHSRREICRRPKIKVKLVQHFL